MFSFVQEALVRGWENIVGRSDGPFNLRLIMQPAMAIFLAVRAGLADARSGQPPFLWTILSDRNRRPELIRHGWRDVRNLFLVAAVLDAIYQIVVQSTIYPLELLLTATTLAFVPYTAVRGLVTRVARRRART
jgi:hypothetical protein